MNKEYILKQVSMFLTGQQNREHTPAPKGDDDDDDPEVCLGKTELIETDILETKKLGGGCSYL